MMRFDVTSSPFAITRELRGRHRLTRQQADSIREKWISQGNSRCDHLSLSLEHTETGYLMEVFLCTQCGAEINRKIA
jgi:hypothetical protein